MCPQNLHLLMGTGGSASTGCGPSGFWRGCNMFSMFSPEWVLSEKVQMSGKVITYQNKHRKIAQLCSFDWRQAIDEI
jgi:hypothetical protein